MIDKRDSRDLAAALHMEAAFLRLAQGVYQQAQTEQQQENRQQKLLTQVKRKQLKKIQQEASAEQGAAQAEKGKLGVKTKQSEDQQSGHPDQIPEYISFLQIGQQQQTAQQQDPQREPCAGFSASVPLKLPGALLNLCVIGTLRLAGDLRRKGLALHSQQLVHGNTEGLCQLWQHGDIGTGLVVFPFAHRLGCDPQQLRQPVLGQSQPLAVGDDAFS